MSANRKSAAAMQVPKEASGRKYNSIGEQPGGYAGKTLSILGGVLRFEGGFLFGLAVPLGARAQGAGVSVEMRRLGGT